MIVGKNVVNIYGSAITDTVVLQVAVYKGKAIYNFTTNKFEDVTAITPGALPAGNLVPTTAIPNTTNKIGYEMNVGDDFPLGFFDLVVMDALVFVQGIRFHKAADGQITVIPE